MIASSSLPDRFYSPAFLQCLWRGQFVWLPPPIFQRTADLYHPQQIQNDEDGCDDEQYVDKVAGLRETRAYAPTEKAEQPQHE
jgi:hypothetical protein